jgi:hypothetical protein
MMEKNLKVEVKLCPIEDRPFIMREEYMDLLSKYNELREKARLLHWALMTYKTRDCSIEDVYAADKVLWEMSKLR